MTLSTLLKKNGIDVYYTRTTDEYETPFKKATDANNSGADLFVSIHRNSSENPNQYSGVETLVYSDTGLKAEVARNINNQLEDAGFKNLGVDERKNLVVLKRTKKPFLLKLDLLTTIKTIIYLMKNSTALHRQSQTEY